MDFHRKGRLSALMAVLLSVFLVTPSLTAASTPASPVAQKKPAKGKAVEKKGKDADKGKTSASEDKKEEDKDAKKFDPSLPAIDLSSDLMYKILHAEFAGYYGDKNGSFEEMMAVARETRDPRLAKRAAQIAVTEKDAEKSLAAVRLWAKSSPDSDEVEQYLVNFLVLNNRLDEIKEHFVDRLAHAKDDARRATLFLRLQQALSNFTDKETAFKVQEEVLKPYDNNADAHVSLAVSALQKSDNARAIVEAERALAIKPDSQLAVLTKAQAVGDVNRALDIMAQFLKAYPEAHEVQVANARLLASEKRYEPALVAFEQVVKQAPKDKMALYSLGLLCMEQGKNDQAEKYFSQWLKVNEETPKDADTASTEEEPDAETMQVYLLLSQVTEDAGRYDRSLYWLGQVPPGVAEEILMLRDVRRAQVYAKKNDMAKMRRVMDDLAKRYPDDKEKILLTETQILRSLKRYQQAYTLLKMELPDYQRSTNVLYDFALTAEFVGQYAEMEKVLRQVMVLDPTFHHAWNALGYSLADRGIRLEEAKGYIEKALELAPNDPYIIDSLGWVYYRLGNLDEAEKILRKAQALNDEAEIAVHLGEVLWMKGQREEALVFFSKARAKDPKDESLTKTLKRLKITPAAMKGVKQ